MQSAGTKGSPWKLQCLCSPLSGNSASKISLVTSVCTNQWKYFASEPLLPGVFNEKISLHLMLFVFSKVS